MRMFFLHHELNLSLRIELHRIQMNTNSVDKALNLGKLPGYLFVFIAVNFIGSSLISNNDGTIPRLRKKDNLPRGNTDHVPHPYSTFFVCVGGGEVVRWSVPQNERHQWKHYLLSYYVRGRQ